MFSWCHHIQHAALPPLKQACLVCKCCQHLMVRLKMKYIALLATLSIAMVLLYLAGLVNKNEPDMGTSPEHQYAPAFMNVLNQKDSEDSGYGKSKLSQSVSLPVQEYCNIPAQVTGLEGVVSNELKLTSVAVVLRHGDRFMMKDTTLGSLRPPTVSCKLSQSDHSHPLVSRFVTDMNSFRHVFGWADAFNFPPYPDSSTCDSEYLSPAGVAQHLHNGVFFRSAYYGKLGLTTNSIQVKSTNYRRTYQSALAFLYGLNPSLDLARFKIYRAETYNTNFCSVEHMGTCLCPAVASLAGSSYHALAAGVRAEDAAHTEFVEAAVSILGAGIRHEYPWKQALDFLMQYACRKQPLPCVGNECFTNTHLNALWHHLSYYTSKQLLNEDFVNMCRIEMQPLMLEIAHRMDEVRRNSSSKVARMYIYSGHDVTLSPLAVSLGTGLSKWPAYASRIVFEHYQNRTDNHHFLRVLINGADVTRNLRFCQTAGNGLCRLEDFMTFVDGDNLRELGYADWHSACYSKHRGKQHGT